MDHQAEEAAQREASSLHDCHPIRRSRSVSHSLKFACTPFSAKPSMALRRTNMMEATVPWWSRIQYQSPAPELRRTSMFPAERGYNLKDSQAFSLSLSAAQHVRFFAVDVATHCDDVAVYRLFSGTRTFVRDINHTRTHADVCRSGSLRADDSPLLS